MVLDADKESYLHFQNGLHAAGLSCEVHQQNGEEEKINEDLLFLELIKSYRQMYLNFF